MGQPVGYTSEMQMSKRLMSMKLLSSIGSLSSLLCYVSDTNDIGSLCSFSDEPAVGGNIMPPPVGVLYYRHSYFVEFLWFMANVQH